MRPFAFERPTSLPDAIDLLARFGERASALAGGTDLIIGLRDGSVRPDLVVDLKHVAELPAGIEIADGRLIIGARATMTDIASHPVVRRDFTALSEAASVVGSVQIRNRATLPGNICNASPAADTVPSLLVYGAIVDVAGPRGERRIPIDDVLVSSGVTTIARDEVVTGVELPLPVERRGSVHQRRTRRRGHDLASVTLACSIAADGTARIAYGSLGPRPLLVTDASGVLAATSSSEHARLEVLEELFVDARPSVRSLRAGPEYRLAMLRVLGLRAVAVARARLDGATDLASGAA